MKILFNVPTASLMATDNEEFNFLSDDTKKYIEENFEVIWNNNTHFSKEELIEKICDVDAVVTHWGSPKIDKDVLEHANKLKKIVAHLAGTVNAYVSEEDLIEELSKGRFYAALDVFGKEPDSLIPKDRAFSISFT